MKASSLLSLILAVALVIVCGRMAFSGKSSADDKAQADTAVNVALDNIMTRASVRSYTAQEVPDSLVTLLLKAGMAAPSAKDMRPWRFVAVTDKDQLTALSKANPYAAPVAKAPLVIVVCGDMRKAGEGKSQEYWIQDTSAASENILLAAQSMGLGAVWTGVWPIQERCKALAEILDAPDYIVPLNLIVVGYPARPQKPKDKYTVDNVSYNSYEGD